MYTKLDAPSSAAFRDLSRRLNARARVLAQNFVPMPTSLAEGIVSIAWKCVVAPVLGLKPMHPGDCESLLE